MARQRGKKKIKMSRPKIGWEVLQSDKDEVCNVGQFKGITTTAAAAAATNIHVKEKERNERTFVAASVDDYTTHR